MIYIFFTLFLIICFALAYFLLVYIYGEKDPRRWKSILVSKNDTSDNIFSQNKRDGNKSVNKNKVFLFVSLLFPLVGAIIYKNFPATFVNFLIIGLISACINILFYFYFTFKNKAKTGDDFYDNNIILIIGGLTLVIPNFILFTLFSLLLSGFKIPFSY